MKRRTFLARFTGFPCAALFVLGHLFTEYGTSYVLEFKVHVLGNPSGSVQLMHLQERFFEDMVIEAMYGIVAAILIFVVQIAMPPRSTPRIRTWGYAVLAGAGYSWIRWAIWGVVRLAGIPYPLSIDFAVAVVLAVWAGVLIAKWRSVPSQREFTGVEEPAAEL